MLMACMKFKFMILTHGLFGIPESLHSEVYLPTPSPFFSSSEILLAGNLQYNTDFVLLEENVQCHCPSFMLFVDVVYVCVCVCMLLKGAVIGDSKFCFIM